MNQIMYCFKSLPTGGVYVDDEKTIEVIRNANTRDNYKILEEQICRSKLMVQQFKRRMQEKYDARCPL